MRGEYELGYQAYCEGRDLSSFQSQLWIDGWLDAEADEDYYYDSYCELYDDEYYYGEWP